MILLQAIDLLYSVFLLMILARIFGSWFPEVQGTTWMAFVAYYSDPYLNFFRSIVPPLGMLDLSPIISLFVLSFGKNLLKTLVYSFLS